jgi:hypothetical protein
MTNESTRAPREGVTRKQRLLAATAIALGLTAAGHLQASELLVVGSTVPGLAPGDVAPTGADIEIPADTEVTLVAPSGGVVKIEGPWSGQFAGGTADSEGGLIQRLYALFQMPDKRSRFGATRSVSRCLVVDLEKDNDICIARPSCVVFQAEGAPQEPVSIDAPGGESIALSRGMGAGMWRWPGDLVHESGTYLVRAGETLTPKSLEVHLQPDDLPTPVHEIAWMGENGCVRQAQEALTELAAN